MKSIRNPCYYVQSFFQREDKVCIPVERKEILEVGILTVYQAKKIIKFKKKKKILIEEGNVNYL